MTTKQPVDRIRIGRVEAAIWENQSEKGAWYAVTLSRSYKDKDGKLQSADSFSAGPDLLVAAEALRFAFLRCRELEK